MKKFTITLEYKGMPITAATAEEAEWKFNELFQIYGKDVWNDCDIIATEEPKRRSNPSHKNFFKKPIDKYIEICYNKNTEREVDKNDSC